MKLLAYPTVLVALLISSHNVDAQIYTWVDEKGKTHYSDKKPEGEVKVTVEDVEQEELNVMESSAMTVDVDQLSQSRKRREAQDKKRQDENNALAAKAWQGKNCYVEVENIHRGNANGTTRIIGTTRTKKCRKAIPRAYQPYLSDYRSE